MAELQLTPEAEVLVEKTTRAISAFDHAQAEIHKALDLLDEAERESVGASLKSTLQMALVTRLCHMTLGGMAMREEQINSIALDLLTELNKLGRDLQQDAAQATRKRKH